MMRIKQIDQKLVLLSSNSGRHENLRVILLLAIAVLISGFSEKTSFAQSAVITFASKSRSKVITPDFNTKSQNYFSVIGEVKNPGCYEWSNEAPTASDVITKAGGETNLSQGSVRIIRRGRAGLRLMSSALTDYSLLSGDILIVEKERQHRSRVIHFNKNQSLNSTSQVPQQPSKETASICVLNLSDHPAVLKVDSSNLSLGSILSNELGLSKIDLNTLRVISPTANRNQNKISAATKLESGSVIIFKNAISDEIAKRLPEPISVNQKQTVLMTPNSVPEQTPQVKNLTTQLTNPVKENHAETLIPFGQLNESKNTNPKRNNPPKDFPILAIPDLNLGQDNTAPKPLEKIELKPASTPKIQSKPNPIRLLPKTPELTEPKQGDLQASVKIQKFDRSIDSEQPQLGLKKVELNKVKVVQTGLRESDNKKTSPFPEYIENVKREALPPIEGEELTSAVPTPVDLGESDLLGAEETSLSDLSLVGIISGVGILVAVISVLISALWNQLDEKSGMREMVANVEEEEIRKQHRERVMTTSNSSQETLKSKNSTLQSLIDNNMPFIEEPVESPSKVEFFGNASKSRTYRVDPVHPRTSPKEEDRKFAAEIPTPHYIKSKHLKKKGTNETTLAGSVVQPPQTQPKPPQNLPEQENIEDLENLAKQQQQTNERLDQGEANQKTQPPAGLIERALMAMKKEMENKKS